MQQRGWRHPWRLAILALACCCWLTACGKKTTCDGGPGGDANNPKVTPANAEKVVVGMSEGEVNDVLGRPMYVSDQQADGKRVRISVWQNGNAHVMVTYDNGRALAKVAAFQ